MTKIMMNIDNKNNIVFSCQNHSKDYNVCTIISTLCNVLVEACSRCIAGEKYYVDGEKVSNIDKIDLRKHSCRIIDDFFDIHIDKGDVRIDVLGAQNDTLEVFETVRDVMRQAAHQHPEHIKFN